MQQLDEFALNKDVQTAFTEVQTLWDATPQQSGQIILIVNIDAIPDVGWPKAGDPIVAPEEILIEILICRNGVDFGSMKGRSNSSFPCGVNLSQNIAMEIDRNDHIELKANAPEKWKLDLRIQMLWLNVDNNNRVIGSHPVKPIKNEPANNDGRTTCFWCGGPLKDSMGFEKVYQICAKCGK